MLRSSCNYYDTPLAYRWKHVDPALAFTARGMHFNRIVPRAFDYATAGVHEKDNILAEIGDGRYTDIDDADVPFHVRQAIRAQTTSAMCKIPSTAPAVMRCLIIAEPLSLYQNVVLRADRIYNDLAVRLLGVGADTDIPDIKAKLIQINIRILSGGLGEETVERYAAMLEWRSCDPRWRGCVDEHDPEALAEVHISILLALGDTWRRLVLKFKGNPWDTLCLAAQSAEFIRTWLGRARCDLCLDPRFSLPVVTGLRNPALFNMETAFLEDMLVRTRVTTVSVERAHLAVPINKTAATRNSCPRIPCSRPTSCHARLSTTGSEPLSKPMHLARALATSSDDKLEAL